MKFKNFYKKDILTNDFELLNSLNEMSIDQDKYPETTKAIFVNDKAINSFNKKIENVKNHIKSDSPLEKVSKNSKAISVNFGGEDSTDNDVYLKQNGKVYHLHNPKSGTTIGKLFKKIVHQKGKGVSWNANVAETAQSLGLYLDGETMLDELGSVIAKGNLNSPIAKFWKKKVISVLGNSQDWNGEGKTVLLTALKSGMTAADFIAMAKLASGITSFNKSIVSKSFKSPNLIHGAIDKYYKAESGNKGLQVDAMKNNTADIIISNVPGADLIEKIKTARVTFNKKSGLNKIGKDIKFYQVSLKKEKDGAQLGKVVTFMRDRYNVSSYQDILQTALTEGFFDKAIDKLKEIGGSVFEKVKNWVGKIAKFGKNIASKMTKASKKQSKKDAKEFADILGVDKEDMEQFVESFTTTESILTEAKKEGVNEILKKLKPKDVNKLIVKVNKRLENFKKNASGDDSLLYKEYGKIAKTKSKTITFNTLTKLLANYTSLELMRNIMLKELRKADNLFKEVIEIQKEMFFGKTRLPLWKVYGAKKFGDTSTFEYLKTGEEFVSDKLKEVKNKKNIAMAFRANPSKDQDYYTFIAHMIMGMDEKADYKYSEFRMGTNQGNNSFSFNLEGSSVISLEQLLKKYN